ncbi:MAG TPA: hypothetical protein PKH05_06955 [Nitrospira sp.]|nr:hypothetical protein [Nitrospira sp.]
MERTEGTLEQSRPGLTPLRQLAAAQIAGEGLAAGNLAICGGAIADCVEALILRNAIEEFADLPLAACGKPFFQRIVHGIGDQGRANVEIAHEPAQSEMIDEMTGAVGDQRQGDQ